MLQWIFYVFFSSFKNIPLINIPNFPKCQPLFAFNCITLDLVFLAFYIFFSLCFKIYILISYQDMSRVILQCP